MNATLAILGTGNMGRALAIAAAKTLSPSHILLTDPRPEAARALAEEIGAQSVASNDEALARARILLLAMKPQQVQGVLADLGAKLRQSAAEGQPRALVSIAAGVQLATLRMWSGCTAAELPLIRLMPNTACAIGHGQILACTEDADAPIDEVCGFLAAAGRISRIPESAMEAGSVVSACAPAFAYIFMEALADGGVRAGLSRQDALQFAAQAVQGAAQMVLQGGQSPAALKDAVCSPAGSTIAGVAALEAHGLRHAAIDAVWQAYLRTLEMGKPA